jgi:hypothetical protein
MTEHPNARVHRWEPGWLASHDEHTVQERFHLAERRARVVSDALLSFRVSTINLPGENHARAAPSAALRAGVR